MNQALPLPVQTASPATRASYTFWLLLFAGTGFVLCLTQAYGLSPDFDQYAAFLDRLREGGLAAVRGSRFEAGFTLLSAWMARAISSDLMLVSVLALATLLMKGWALQIACSTRAIFVAVALYYLLRVYPLHELTQIRISVALAFLLLGQVALWSGRRALALLACAIALAFHTSAAAVVPFMLFQPQARWKAVLAAIFVFLAMRLQLAAIVQHGGTILAPLTMYQENGFGDRPVNPVALAILLDWCMVLYALLRWDALSVYSRRALFVPLIGLALYYGAMPYPVLAHRLSEMFAVFWIFFLAGALARSSTRAAAAGFMLLSGAWYSYIYIFSDRVFS
jgi:hypothetical protein